MNQATFQDHPLKANGRFGRLSFLAWSFLGSIILSFFLFILSSILGDGFNLEDFSTASPIAILILILIYIVFIYFYWVFTIRRLHDRNHSGWLSLLLLVPLINIIFALYLLFAKGTSGANHYGPQRFTPVWEKILGWIYILTFFLGLIAAISLPAYQNYAEKVQQQQSGKVSL